MQALTDKFECKSFSNHAKKYVAINVIYQMTKYLQRRPIGYVTFLHVPVRPCNDISMDFFKLSAVFTKCPFLQPNIHVVEDQIDCISRLLTIVNIQLGLKYLIPVANYFTSKQCHTTFDMHGVSIVRYPYCTSFDQATLFMSAHFQSWAATKGIKLEPSTTYYYEMDSQSEIGNSEIITVARACKAGGNEWLNKIP